MSFEAFDVDLNRKLAALAAVGVSYGAFCARLSAARANMTKI